MRMSRQELESRRRQEAGALSPDVLSGEQSNEVLPPGSLVAVPPGGRVQNARSNGVFSSGRVRRPEAPQPPGRTQGSRRPDRQGMDLSLRAGGPGSSQDVRPLIARLEAALGGALKAEADRIAALAARVKVLGETAEKLAGALEAIERNLGLITERAADFTGGESSTGSAGAVREVAAAEPVIPHDAPYDPAEEDNALIPPAPPPREKTLLPAEPPGRPPPPNRGPTEWITGDIR